MPVDFSRMLPPDATDEEKNKYKSLFYGPTAARSVDPNANPDGSPMVGPISVGGPRPQEQDLVHQMSQQMVAQNQGPKRDPFAMPNMNPPPVAAAPQVNADGFPIVGQRGTTPLNGRLPKGGDTPAAWAAVRQDNNQTNIQDALARAREAQAAQYGSPSGAGSQGTKPVVIPGARTAAQWHIAQGNPVSQQVMGGYEDADIERQRAIDMHKEAGENEAAMQAGYFQKMQDFKAAHEQNIKADENRRKTQMDDAYTKLGDITKSAQDQKIDDHAFLIPGAAGDFLSSIGVAIGAGAQALGHMSENPAMGVVNAAIGRQMKRQQMAADKAHGALDDQKSLIGQLRVKFGDEHMADNAAYIAYLDRADSEAKALAAKSATPELAAKVQDFQAGLAHERAERMELFERAAQDHVQRTDVMTQTKVIGGAPPKPKGLDDDVHRYSKDLQEAKVPETVAALKRADELVDQFGEGDIPGIGGGADAREKIGGLANKATFGLVSKGALLSDSEQDVRQLRQGIENEVIKSLAGANVAPAEEARILAQLRGANTAKGFRQTLDGIRARVAEVQKNAQAGSGPNVAQKYEENGGTILNVRRNAPQAPYVSPVK